MPNHKPKPVPPQLAIANLIEYAIRFPDAVLKTGTIVGVPIFGHVGSFDELIDRQIHLREGEFCLVTHVGILVRPRRFGGQVIADLKFRPSCPSSSGLENSWTTSRRRKARSHWSCEIMKTAIATGVIVEVCREFGFIHIAGGEDIPFCRSELPPGASFDRRLLNRRVTFSVTGRSQPQAVKLQFATPKKREAY